jgi:hypothetical protein
LHLLKIITAYGITTGAAWVASGATGDIEGVTAGTGISGGGTSGTVTITNSMATEIDAKGDLVVGTGADTFARLAVGTNGTVLTAASGEATGLKWAASAAGGKVLQVVSQSTSTEVAITTSSQTDSGLTATITPSAASSKILVLVTQIMLIERSDNQIFYGYFLYRDATDIFTTRNDGLNMRATGTTLVGRSVPTSISYLDAPNTTSAVTYKTRGERQSGSGTIKFQPTAPGGGSTSGIITLLEIGA